MATKVIIKQFKNKAKKPVAGLTPEHAVYDANGVRLDAKLGSWNLSNIRDAQTESVRAVREAAKQYDHQTVINNGTITNAADEEDITVRDNVLSFKNRTYIEGVNEMGYIILRKNKSFAEQVTKKNTIYEIRYEFNLNSVTITIPENCILKFKGGIINNGSIIGNNTKLDVNDETIFSNIIINGTWNISQAKSIWFSQTEDDNQLLQNLNTLSKNIYLNSREYNLIKQGITLDCSSLSGNNVIINFKENELTSGIYFSNKRVELNNLTIKENYSGNENNLDGNTIVPTFNEGTIIINSCTFSGRFVSSCVASSSAREIIVNNCIFDNCWTGDHFIYGSIGMELFTVQHCTVLNSYTKNGAFKFRSDKITICKFTDNYINELNGYLLVCNNNSNSIKKCKISICDNYIKGNLICVNHEASDNAFSYIISNNYIEQDPTYPLIYDNIDSNNISESIFIQNNNLVNCGFAVKGHSIILENNSCIVDEDINIVSNIYAEYLKINMLRCNVKNTNVISLFTFYNVPLKFIEITNSYITYNGRFIDLTGNTATTEYPVIKLDNVKTNCYYVIQGKGNDVTKCIISVNNCTSKNGIIYNCGILFNDISWDKAVNGSVTFDKSTLKPYWYVSGNKIDANGYEMAITHGMTPPTLNESHKGFCFYHEYLNKPMWWTGTKWVDATGADV